MNNALYALMVEKPYVLKNDVSTAKKFFKMIDLKEGKDARNKVFLYIDGYNDVPEELYEIPEVQKWVRKLVNEVPHMWYYVNKDKEADIAWIMSCLSTSLHALKFGENKPISAYSWEEIKKLPKVHVHISVSKHLISRMVRSTIEHATRMGDTLGGLQTVEFIEKFFDTHQG